MQDTKTTSKPFSPLDEAAVQYYKNSPSPENKEALVNEAKGLVYHFVKIYGGGTRTDDLIQTGMVGLLKAINKFDPDKGVKFATYASECIIGEIRHFVRKESSYYTPGCIVGLQNKVNGIIDDCLKKYGTMPCASEIAEQLGVREESVTEIMNAGLVDFSQIETENIKTVRHSTFQLPIEDKLLLEQAFNKLNELQKQVIYLLFYLDLTQIEVASLLGISQRQVSRIKNKCIKLMREETGGYLLN